jgi:hypothetical protein
MGALFIGLPVLAVVCLVAATVGIGPAIGLALGLVVLERFIRRVIPWLRLRHARRQQQPPRVMALTKASEGAGLLALAAVVVSEESFPAVASTPALWVPVLAVTAWGALWLVTSGLAVRQFGWQGPVDAVVFVRALVKITFGVAVFYLMPPGLSHLDRLLWGVRNPPDIQTLVIVAGFAVGWLVAFWCIVTGSAKLLLLLSTQIRSRPKAPADGSAHGEGREETDPAKAADALRGRGRRSRMEGVEF